MVCDIMYARLIWIQVLCSQSYHKTNYFCLNVKSHFDFMNRSVRNINAAKSNLSRIDTFSKCRPLGLHDAYLYVMAGH